MNKQKVCCLYRVSTNKQVDRDKENNADIPMQRKACRSFAERMGWEIIREEQETGVSGFTVSAADCDKIQLIKSEAQKGSFDILLVFMFDRLGRKADETPFVVEWFAKHDIQVWSVQEGEQRFESHTDHFTNYIRFWQADGESQKTSMRTKTALAQMVQDCCFRGGVAPFGYRLENSGIFNKRKHEVKMLVIDEEEAKIVRTIFSLCAGSGYGRYSICTYLNELKIPTRKGDTWHESTVGHILHNITYLGILRSGETQSEIFPELQIIEPNTFELVQKINAQRVQAHHDKPHLPQNVKGKALLSGNVFCGHCGCHLSITTSGKVSQRQSPNKEVVKRIRYICYNKTRKRTPCDGQSGYTAHLVDDVVRDKLALLFDEMNACDKATLLTHAKQKALNQLKKELTRAERNAISAANEHDALKQEVVNAIQGNRIFPSDLLCELIEKAAQKRLFTCEALATIQNQTQERSKNIADIQHAHQDLLYWSKTFDSSDLSTQKMIAAYLIKSVHVRKEYAITIEFNPIVTQFQE